VWSGRIWGSRSTRLVAMIGHRNPRGLPLCSGQSRAHRVSLLVERRAQGAACQL
jgi:hypothetical protein